MTCRLLPFLCVFFFYGKGEGVGLWDRLDRAVLC